MKTYRIERISDLFAVPPEKRQRCLREIEYGVSLAELAFGVKAADSMTFLEWTDDDDASVALGRPGQQRLPAS